MRISFFTLMAVPAMLLSVTSARAQTAAAETAAKPATDENAAKIASAPAEYGRFSPYEDPNQAYYFVNLRFRDVIIPKFMINIFADGGATVNAMTFGPEFTYRKGSLELDFAASYADYSMDPFLFKSHGDGSESFERVRSSLKILYLTLDILYNIPLDNEGYFSLLVGGGVGLGGVLGDLNRNQVTPLNNTIDPNRVSSTRDCLPSERGQSVYCDDSNDHYGGYKEASWANGGSKPFIFPWISLPQVSLRIKPIKQLQTRLDAGFSLTGFFFGMSAGYTLPFGGNASSDAKP
jgi:hypothetical protein